MVTKSTYQNHLYRFEWKNKASGYEYRLDVYPSYATNITTQEIIIMPDDCIKKIEYSTGYDRYFFGMPKQPNLDVTFDIAKTMNTGHFNNCLIDVFIHNIRHFHDFTGDWTGFNSTSPAIDNSTFNLDFFAGNVYTLYCKFNGNDTVTTPPEYRLIYQGTQVSGLEGNYDVSNYEYKVQTKHILSFAMESVNISMLKEIYRYVDPTKTNKYQNEVIFDCIGSAEWSLLSHIYNDAEWALPEFLYLKVSEILSFLFKLVEEVLSKVLRVAIATIDSTVIWNEPIYCKQVYDGTGNVGAALAFSDLYVTGFITVWVGYWKYKPLLCEALSSKYANMYDFFVDFFENYLNRGIYKIYTAAGVTHYDLLGLKLQCVSYSNDRVGFPFCPDMYTPPPFVSDLKIDTSSEINKKVTVSYPENTQDDLKCAELVNTGARNDKGFGINVIFTNMPTISKYNRYYDAPGTSFNQYFYDIDSPRMNLLYYYDSTISQFVKVHDYMRIDIGNGISTDDYCGTQIFENKRDNTHPTSLHFREIQEAQSYGNYIGKLLLKKFSREYQTKIKGKTFFNIGNNFTDAGNVTNANTKSIWFPEDNVFAIIYLDTLTPYDPHSSVNEFFGANYDAESIINEMKIDFLNESVEFGSLTIYSGS